jgi:hypothetical protein
VSEQLTPGRHLPQPKVGTFVGSRGHSATCRNSDVGPSGPLAGAPDQPTPYLICSGRCATRRPTVTGGNDGRRIAIWFAEIARCSPFADRNCVVNDWNLELGFSKHLRAFLFFFLFVFFVNFGCCSQNDDDRHEDDLANFGYKINMKVKYLKTILLYTIFLATYLNHIYRDLAIFLKLWSKYGYWKSQQKKHMNLALLKNNSPKFVLEMDCFTSLPNNINK